MEGAGAYPLRVIGAFIRWIISGFQTSFKGLLNGPLDDSQKSFKNDLLNIFIALVFIVGVFAIIQVVFF